MHYAIMQECYCIILVYIVKHPLPAKNVLFLVTDFKPSSGIETFYTSVCDCVDLYLLYCALSINLIAHLSVLKHQY